MLRRVQESTPLVSRSDGETFHLYLQNGPLPQLAAGGAPTGNMLAYFRYASDANRSNRDTVALLLSAADKTPPAVLRELEAAADVLAARLAASASLAYAYSFIDGQLQTVRPAAAAPAAVGK